jgi:hypothetical protein
MICSGVYLFLLISLPPSIHRSNLTGGLVLGGQVNLSRSTPPDLNAKSQLAIFGRILMSVSSPW